MSQNENQNENDTKIAAVVELLASRICHDVISPVGAINNGIELMQELGPDGIEDGIELIGYSAEQAAAKLAAFRLAYGAGGKDPHIKPEDVQRNFGALIRAEGKVNQAWDPHGSIIGGAKPGDTLPPAYCKMLMGALMLAMESLPKGGYISVRPGVDNQTLIIAEGAGAVIRDNVEQAMKQALNPSDLDPRLVHPYALSVIAQSYGYDIAITSINDGRIEFTLNCPLI